MAHNLAALSADGALLLHFHWRWLCCAVLTAWPGCTTPYRQVVLNKRNPPCRESGFMFHPRCSLTWLSMFFLNWLCWVNPLRMVLNISRSDFTDKLPLPIMLKTCIKSCRPVILYIYFQEDLSKGFSNLFCLLAFTEDVCNDLIFTSYTSRQQTKFLLNLDRNLSNILSLSPVPAVINVRQF